MSLPSEPIAVVPEARRCRLGAIGVLGPLAAASEPSQSSPKPVPGACVGVPEPLAATSDPSPSSLSLSARRCPRPGAHATALKACRCHRPELRLSPEPASLSPDPTPPSWIHRHHPRPRHLPASSSSTIGN
ncbi:hypothetical protein GUJ93_ZPchr0008g13271 [Zizania palustris]|uniref:Uncharacterized protein n=1 Tax=Zizania palustris TaxID=103762 RepID=A0A8J5VHP2_ZIZPA|nr:hypothetical protein GUJ93_ZPchr0008g13271 [Zizania palustris]